MIKKFKKTWEKYTQGVLGTIIYVILGFLIAFGTNAVLSFALHTDTPVVAVFSESMVPNLQKGDMVVIYGTDDIKVGDIVVYDSPIMKYPIIHRVISIENGTVETKGDNNPIADPWKTPFKKIHGKAILKIPVLGWVKIIFTSIVGL